PESRDGTVGGDGGPAAHAARLPGVGAGPERATGAGPVAMPATPLAEEAGGAVVTVEEDDDDATTGAAVRSGPPTPAFWPQAADVSTAIRASSDRNRNLADRMDRQGTDRRGPGHPGEGGSKASTTGRSWS
ncbi:MAG: hypothetical protein QOJ23_395, partial [Actinomycetota bacterium]|nr:hypothetical protein [Actinomycetota bacterium]